MLVEVANQNLVGGALDKAIELLQQMSESIRLKIGRPDVSSSVVVVQDGEEVSCRNNIYDCKIVCTILISSSQQPIHETLERVSPTERDLMMKLEKSQMRVVEVRMKCSLSLHRVHKELPLSL